MADTSPSRPGRRSRRIATPSFVLLPDVIFRLTLRPRLAFEFLTPAVEAVTGYSAERFLADPRLLTRISGGALRRRLSALAKRPGGTAGALVFPLTHADGRRVWIETRSRAVRGRTARAIAVEGIARDVTASHRRLLQSRQATRDLVQLIEEIPVGIGRLSVDGTWLDVNRRLCEITGYTKRELVGMSFRAITHPDDLTSDLALMQRAVNGEIPQFAITKRYIRKDGTVVWVKLLKKLVRARSGAPAYGVGVVDYLGASPPAHAMAAFPGTLQYGPLEIDLARLKLRIHGRPFVLTWRELMMLWYLVAHRGQILSRTRLLTDVWGYRNAGGTRTVDVHVHRLRQKLPYLARAVETVDRTGYRLVDPPPDDGAGPGPVAGRAPRRAYRRPSARARRRR